MINETILAGVATVAAALAIAVDRALRRSNSRKATGNPSGGDGNGPKLVLYRLDALDKATSALTGNVGKLTERVVRIESQTNGLGSAIKDGFERVETELNCVKKLAGSRQASGSVRT